MKEYFIVIKKGFKEIFIIWENVKESRMKIKYILWFKIFYWVCVYEFKKKNILKC